MDRVAAEARPRAAAVVASHTTTQPLQLATLGLPPRQIALGRPHAQQGETAEAARHQQEQQQGRRALSLAQEQQQRHRQQQRQPQRRFSHGTWCRAASGRHGGEGRARAQPWSALGPGGGTQGCKSHTSSED